jgi:hypothetical protein
MFSLVITIISIALVAALALATLYYGGTAFNKGSSEAQTTQLLTEAQQVRGAVELYRADTGAAPVDIDALVTASYLKQVPTGWTFIEGAAVQAASSEDVCLTANRRLGINLVPTCSDPAYANVAVCCSYPQ